MRTTIELRDDLRARLLEMAARRGEKGFSSLVGEAVEMYLEAQRELDKARQLALKARGSLGEGEAEKLRAAAARVRAEWR
jgi:predicted transcriptional regulator